MAKKSTTLRLIIASIAFMRSVIASTLVLSITLLALVSCSAEVENESGQTETEGMRRVAIMTRGVSNIDYPIAAYAFNSQSKLQEKVVVSSNTEQLEFKLPLGSFSVILLSGTEGLDLPEEVTPASVVNFPETGMLTHSVALGNGNCAITINDEAPSVDVSLEYLTASVAVSINGVPENVKSITATIRKTYHTFGLNKGNQNLQDTRIELAKSQGTEGLWSSGTVFVLPSSEGDCNVTIEITDVDNKTIAYDCTIGTTLEAKRQYNINCNYVKNKALNVNITGPSFEGTVNNITLSFGPAVSEGSTNGEEDNPQGGEETVSTIPALLSLYQGCMVIDVDNATETGADITLLSNEQWTCLPNVDGSANPEAAATIVSNYNTDGKTGWVVPTSSQTERLTGVFSTNAAFSELNQALTEAGIPALTKGNGTATNENNYLCEDASKYYAWGYGLSEGKLAANKNTTYNLRLIKIVHVSK